jgi:hypothetical protein
LVDPPLAAFVVIPLALFAILVRASLRSGDARGQQPQTLGVRE